MHTYFQQAANNLWGTGRQIKKLKNYTELVKSDLKLIEDILDIKKCVQASIHLALKLLEDKKSLLTIKDMKNERDLHTLSNQLEGMRISNKTLSEASKELTRHLDYMQLQLKYVLMGDPAVLNKALQISKREEAEYRKYHIHSYLKKYYSHANQASRIATGLRNNIAKDSLPK